ncbi:hypothetical protein BH20ACI2_BH20ACI2_23840 [soil metagenome]
MGDSRQTSYFYAFEGVQGDIFINVVTKNLTGDVDVFTADSLHPLTKIVLYADSSPNETGRLIYLRKPARLILRVEGRTPNDDPATFRIKFAGSFVALAAKETEEAPVVERSERDDSSGVRVNSVGTIIEVLPQKTKRTESAPEKKEAVAEPEAEPAEAVTPGKETPAVRISPSPEVKTIFGNKSTRREENVSGTPKKNETSPATARRNRGRTPSPEAEVKAPDPLASIRLVIEMKDGEVIERPMNEVIRFSVDKGILTVITNDRKTVRYSILLVERVTIK